MAYRFLCFILMGGDELAILLQTSKSISVHLKLVWHVVINQGIDSILMTFDFGTVDHHVKSWIFCFQIQLKCHFSWGYPATRCIPVRITSYRITYSEPPMEWLSFH